MNITLVTPYTRSSLRAVKIAALYFDKTILMQRALLEIEGMELEDEVRKHEMREGVIREIHPYVGPAYQDQLRPLIEAKVVEIREQNSDSAELSLEADLPKLMNTHSNLFLPVHPAPDAGERGMVLETSQNLVEIHERLVGRFAVGGVVHFQAIAAYYSGLVADIARAARRGEAVTTSDVGIHKLLREKDAREMLGLGISRIAESSAGAGKFALDVLDAAIPDVSDLEIEDILEIRTKLADELIAFRSELENLQFDLREEFGDERLLVEGRKIAQARILPKIRDIERSIRSSKVAIFEKLVQSLKNPSYYVPVIGSRFVGMPIELSLMLGLGIITADVALEKWKQTKELKTEGLLYLIKVREGVRDASSLSRIVPNVRNPPIEMTRIRRTHFFLTGQVERCDPPA